jgi:hypothetical protein
MCGRLMILLQPDSGINKKRGCIKSHYLAPCPLKGVL